MPGVTMCGGFEKKQVAGVEITSVMRLYFDGKLASMSFYFPEDGFRKLAEVLTLKYGPTDSVYPTTVQNRMGAKFDNETRRWKFSDGVMQISRYGSKVTEGSVTIGSFAFMQAGEVRRRAAAAAAAARDLAPPVKK